MSCSVMEFIERPSRCANSANVVQVLSVNDRDRFLLGSFMVQSYPSLHPSVKGRLNA